MAEVKLFPRKEFEIILDDGTSISGKYGTWAVKRYCDLRGISFEELLKEDEQKKDESNVPYFQKMDDAIKLILSAVEYNFRLNKKPFNYSEENGYDWIDQIKTEGLKKLLDHAIGEKKNTSEDLQTGMISKESSIVQVET